MNVAAALALTAALLHVLNHALFKSLLFFGAGAVLHATGERDMERLGGLIHRMPQTAVVLPDRLRRDLGAAAAQRLRLGMAHLPGDPGEPGTAAVGPELRGRRRSARCWRWRRRSPPRASSRLGIAFLGRPRSAAAAQRARGRPLARSPRCSSSPALVLLPACCPGCVIDALAPVRADARRRRAAARRRRGLALARADRRRAAAPTTASSSLVFMAIASATLTALAIHRFATRATRRGAGLGLRLSRSRAADPIHRVELRPADPPGVRRPWCSAPASGSTCRSRATLAPADFRSRVRDLAWDVALRPRRARPSRPSRAAQRAAVPHHPPLSRPGVLRAGHPAADRGGGMALIVDLVLQGVQMLLVLLLAPLAARRDPQGQGAAAAPPRPAAAPALSRHAAKLLRKEAVLAENASWLFRAAPYLIFAAHLGRGRADPDLRPGPAVLLVGRSDRAGRAARHRALRWRWPAWTSAPASAASARSREMMIASLAEPAMLLIVFTARPGRRHHPAVRHRRLLLATARGLRVSLGLALVALIMVAHRRERPRPGRQSGDPSRAHHGARGDGAGIFRPPPRHDRGGCRAQAGALPLADRLPVRALRHGAGDRGRRRACCSGSLAYLAKIAARRRAAGDVRDQHRQDAGVPRPRFPRRRLAAAAARRVLLFVSRGVSMRTSSPSTSPICSPAPDAGASFVLLYQDRITAVLNIFALQAVALALAVAWQA